MSELQAFGRPFILGTPEGLLGPLNDIEAKFAPPNLHVAGDIRLLEGPPRVSVIGTRKPSDEGVARTRRLVRELIKKSVIIVSGLAEGIDSVAHLTAIREGGRTIAVLGTPLNQVYPRKNLSLQLEIMEHHLAISQFPEGYPIQRRNFPFRNRTMALVSDASVIIEAGESSGTLSQGWETLRLGKPLFIMRSVCENPKLSWPKEMIEYGALELAEPGIFFRHFPAEEIVRERNVTF
jgi:DNA processing protein